MRNSLQPDKDAESIFKSRRLSSSAKKMHEFSTLSWFKKRFPCSTKERYLYSNQEMHQIQMATEVFKDYDQDNSGTLELEEVYSMFQLNGINISRKKLSHLFCFVKSRQKHRLNLEEFKQLTFCTRANEYFREIMKEAKKELELERRPWRHLPLDFQDMLRLLYDKTRREKFIDSVNFSDVQNDLQSFKSAININTDLSKIKNRRLKVKTDAHRSFIKKVLNTSIIGSINTSVIIPSPIDTSIDTSLAKIPEINSKSTHFTGSPDVSPYKPITKLQLSEALKQKLVQANLIRASDPEVEISAKLLHLKNKRVRNTFSSGRTLRGLSRGVSKEQKLNKSSDNLSVLLNARQGLSVFNLNSSSFR
jgi:hypothetical protein